jgi:hypothetical protein
VAERVGIELTIHDRDAELQRPPSLLNWGYKIAPNRSLACKIARLVAGGDSRVSPSPVGTLVRHPEGEKSRLRALSLAPISEPHGRANNGAATSRVTDRAKSKDKERRTQLVLLSAVVSRRHWKQGFSVGRRTKARTRDPLIKRRVQGRSTPIPTTEPLDLH